MYFFRWFAATVQKAWVECTNACGPRQDGNYDNMTNEPVTEEDDERDGVGEAVRLNIRHYDIGCEYYQSVPLISSLVTSWMMSWRRCKYDIHSGKYCYLKNIGEKNIFSNVRSAIWWLAVTFLMSNFWYVVPHVKYYTRKYHKGFFVFILRLRGILTALIAHLPFSFVSQ